jgi:hypothetical protein
MTYQPVALSLYNDLVGTTFRVGTPPYAMSAPLTLQTVTRTPGPAGAESLSLVFQGPHEPFIAQGTYFFLHDQLPPQSLFLVPIGQDNHGFRYEVVFNNYTPDSTPTASEGDAQ